MREDKGSVRFRDLCEESGSAAPSATVTNGESSPDLSSPQSRSGHASSPEVQRTQRTTPLRMRAQLHHVWNSSPSRPSTVRRRREKLQAQKPFRMISHRQPSLAAQISPGLRSVSLDRLDMLNRREFVWGSHADFELRERLSSLHPATPKFEVQPNGDASIQQARPETGTPSNGESEQLFTGKAPRTPPRPPPNVSLDGTPNPTKRSAIKDPARKLTRGQLIRQRLGFFMVVFCLNAACLIAALESHRHLWVLVLILFLKAKDILSTLAALTWITATSCRRSSRKSTEVPPKWILTCVTAYAETEVQIMRTINSILEHHPTPHKMVLCIILDGKPVNVRSYFTRSARTFQSSYQTWKFAHGELNIYTGFMGEVPVILFDKVRNAGKKDSLILCHDIFDVMRDNAPLPTQSLRRKVWTEILPSLLDQREPSKFDYIFCTDADSLIHKGTVQRLVTALSENPKAIGACGLVLCEMEKGNEWSIWYLFQQFQYTFGQFVRRRAEAIWGRVTCLPGCVTMISVRDEMAGAIKMYAEPVTGYLVFRHQVQYLGTDRRLTFCMLSQGKHLRTLFVPHAVSETVAPQGFLHYMSQRRRWGSNAYFNDYFYFIGSEHWIITRIWALIDIIRMTLVYYRVANTIMFIYGLYRHFVIIKLIPYIIVTQTPTLWFVVLVLFREPLLRKQAHKLFVGWIINKFISPIFSMLIFSNVMLNLGSPVWGRTGASTESTNALDILHTITPKSSWSPWQIAHLVRETLREQKGKKTQEKQKEQNPQENLQRDPLYQPLRGRNTTTGYSSKNPTPAGNEKHVNRQFPRINYEDQEDIFY